MGEPIRCFDGTKKPHEAFWRFRDAVESEGGDPELEFYGYISEYSWYEDDITPGKFKKDLHDRGAGGPITIRLNSGGGDVIAASVIRAILKDYPGKITVKIDGMAASAAVIVAMAGDRVLIQDSAYMMIHDPAVVVWLASLNITTLEGLLSELKTIRNGIVETYAARTGMSVDRLTRMMAAETWMTANEAVTMGFADEVIGGNKAAPAAAIAVTNALRNYANVPASLRDQFMQEPATAVIAPEVKRLRDEVKLLR